MVNEPDMFHFKTGLNKCFLFFLTQTVQPLFFTFVLCWRKIYSTFPFDVVILKTFPNDKLEGIHL